jgi:hypothetical protein
MEWRMAWSFDVDTAAGGARSYRLRDPDGRAVSRQVALARIAADSGFREQLTGILAAAPCEAFFWECPPTSNEHQERAFEFVLIDAPALARVRADPSSFGAEFDRRPEADTHTFENLSGDAVLVVPAPRANPSAYAHLAAFLREAPSEQIDALWRAVALALEQRLSHAPLWLSTAGLGVPWLHIRLDSRPKYYRHTPFTKPPA